MAFGRLEDATGNVPIVVFPKSYEEYSSIFKEDAVLLVKGKVDNRDDELQLIVEKLTTTTEIDSGIEATNPDHEIFIPRHTGQETLQKLGKLLKANPGEETTAILIPNGGKPQRMLLPYGVAWSPLLEAEVQSLLAEVAQN